MKWARTLRVSHALALLVLANLTVIAGCGGFKVASVWRDRDVVIDGVPSEWQGTATWVENPNVSIGVMNDDDYLYLCLSTPVRGIAAEIMHQGMTVWFDPWGRGGKVFGIHCPVGFSGPPSEPDRVWDVAQDRRKFQEMLAGELRSAAMTLQVLGPGKSDTLTFRAGEESDVQVMLGYESGRFVYELKAPLGRSDQHPYGMGYAGASSISIGFETPEITLGSMDRRMPRGGPPPGVMGEPDGGDESGFGTERPERAPGSPDFTSERLQVWGTVHMASK
jgi:hypothetical protein